MSLDSGANAPAFLVTEAVEEGGAITINVAPAAAGNGGALPPDVTVALAAWLAERVRSLLSFHTGWQSALSRQAALLQIKSRMEQRQQRLLQAIQGRSQGVRATELMGLLGSKKATLMRDLHALKEAGLVERRGSGKKATYYPVALAAAAASAVAQ